MAQGIYNTENPIGNTAAAPVLQQTRNQGGTTSNLLDPYWMIKPEASNENAIQTTNKNTVGAPR